MRRVKGNQYQPQKTRVDVCLVIKAAKWKKQQAEVPEWLKRRLDEKVKEDVSTEKTSA
jgi:hypothetical protein